MEDALAAEYLALLARAGITMPPERLAGAVEEYADIRTHIDRVNAACPSDAEPATLFGLPR